MVSAPIGLSLAVIAGLLSGCFPLMPLLKILIKLSISKNNNCVNGVELIFVSFLLPSCGKSHKDFTSHLQIHLFL